MKHKDLVDKIKDLHHKNQFLEAFLLQSAFIEALFKRLLENDFVSAISFPLQLWNSKNNKQHFGTYIDSKQVTYLKKKVMRQDLHKIIDYFDEMYTFDSGFKKQLHEYREKRNRVLHDLLGTTSKDDFEKEIENSFIIGQEILDNSIMVIASNSSEQLETLEKMMKDND